MESTTQSKVYLPSLHGLRFLAAFSVFLGHLDQAMSWQGWIRFPFRHTTTLPTDGVTFFFVLSGFLITYLLLTERKEKGKIDINQFYLRRILRIWPLYYLFTFLTFFVFNHLEFLQFPVLDMAVTGLYWKKLILFLFFSPHLAISLFTSPGVGGPLWSVGVEEYFYLFWPQMVQRFKSLLPWVFVTLMILPMWLRNATPQPWATFFEYLRFDCIAIGGLGAWLYLNVPKSANLIFFMPVQLIAYFFAIRHVLYEVHYGYAHYIIYSIIYIILIMNVSLNSRSLLNLENRFFRYMGEISYGFYVFQWLCNVVCVNAYIKYPQFEKLGLRIFSFISPRITAETFRWMSLFVGDFALTTALASLSYFALERRFLIKKKKFAPVLAGTSALKLSFAPNPPQENHGLTT